MTRATVARFLSVLVLIALIASPLAAHPLAYSQLDVRIQQHAVDLSLVLHLTDAAGAVKLSPPQRLLEPAAAAAAADSLAAIVARRLTITIDGAPAVVRWSRYEPAVEGDSIRMRARVVLARPVGTFAVAGPLVPDDPAHQTFVNIHGSGEVTQALLHSGRTVFEHFEGTRQGVSAVFAKFFRSGIHHIVIGPDHVLFVIGLLLLGGTIRRLAIVVTAFTAAHSVTLTLAVLDVVTLPPHLVEPAIALSIVYVGADNLLVRNGRDVRAWIAFLFGFIHGFGFAGVLGGMDIPARSLGWSLFAFNLGVEAGQLAIVVAVASLLAALRSRHEAAARMVATGGSVAVIAAGLFWFVERVFVTRLS